LDQSVQAWLAQRLQHSTALQPTALDRANNRSRKPTSPSQQERTNDPPEFVFAWCERNTPLVRLVKCY
jgi:hypothetical protein